MQLKDCPVCLILTRQAVPTFDRTRYAPASGVARGAYVLADAEDGKPDVLLLSTGSEVSLCVTANEQLKSEGIKARVDQHAFVEIVRKSESGVSRQSFAAPGIGTGRG